YPIALASVAAHSRRDRSSRVGARAMYLSRMACSMPARRMASAVAIRQVDRVIPGQPLAAQPEPFRIDLVSITVDDARTLNGKRVRVSFVTGKPSYALNGVTVTGPADPEQDGEDVSRGVGLRGEPIIDPGERV